MTVRAWLSIIMVLADNGLVLLKFLFQYSYREADWVGGPAAHRVPSGHARALEARRRIRGVWRHNTTVPSSVIPLRL